MPKHLLLDAIKLCYGVNNGNSIGRVDSFKFADDDDQAEKNHHTGNTNGKTSSVTLALASGLPQYFAMLYCQLSEDRNDKTVSADFMMALMNILTLKQPKHCSQSYSYPQFCSAILDQFNRTYLNKPKNEMRLPTMENHLNDLVKSSDWQWQQLETINERYLVNKLTTETTNLQMYDIEIENLMRQIVHKNAENEVLKTVCHDLCSHIRRMDSAYLALQVKLLCASKSSMSTINGDSRNCVINDDVSNINSSSTVKKTKRLQKLNSRLVKQMHSISNKMTTLKRTLTDAKPLVRRLEELFAVRGSSSSNKSDEKPNGNNVSVADSGWMSDDDMQFSEAMTTSGASDLFAQTTTNDKETKQTTMESRATVVVPGDDLSEISSSRRSEKISKNLSSSKKSTSLAVPETDDEFCCEECYEEDAEDDDDEDETEEDPTTRELKAKLFLISQRLNEAERKLHGVLQNTK